MCREARLLPSAVNRSGSSSGTEQKGSGSLGENPRGTEASQRANPSLTGALPSGGAGRRPQPPQPGRAPPAPPAPPAPRRPPLFPTAVPGLPPAEPLPPGPSWRGPGPSRALFPGGSRPQPALILGGAASGPPAAAGARRQPPPGEGERTGRPLRPSASSALGPLLPGRRERGAPGGPQQNGAVTMATAPRPARGRKARRLYGSGGRGPGGAMEGGGGGNSKGSGLGGLFGAGGAGYSHADLAGVPRE